MNIIVSNGSHFDDPGRLSWPRLPGVKRLAAKMLPVHGTCFQGVKESKNLALDGQQRQMRGSFSGACCTGWLPACVLGKRGHMCPGNGLPGENILFWAAGGNKVHLVFLGKGQQTLPWLVMHSTAGALESNLPGEAWPGKLIPKRKL